VRAAAAAASAVYTAPSQRIGANELQVLSRLSGVVPDTLLLEAPLPPKAATVSAQVLRGVMASGQLGMKPFMVRAPRPGPRGQKAVAQRRARALTQR
jgi:hypothetical protein